jgi:hypothetical protein
VDARVAVTGLLSSRIPGAGAAGVTAVGRRQVIDTQSVKAVITEHQVLT